MWYCYFLSNQKNGIMLNTSIYGNECKVLSQELIQRYYQNQIKIQNIFQQVAISHTHKILDVIQIEQKDSKPLPNASTNQIFFQQKKLQVKKSSNEQKKFKKSLKRQEQDLMKYKNAGRNSTSNIFKVFLKLCSKPKLESLIKDKFKEIIKKYSLFISYQYFKIHLKEISPSTSNYINIKQFKKIWEGQSQFSKIFRCLFHWFLSSFAINHSLTLRGKHKMMKESIIHFLQNIHGIERELRGQQIQQQFQKYDSQTIKGEYTQ